MEQFGPLPAVSLLPSPCSVLLLSSLLSSTELQTYCIFPKTIYHTIYLFCLHFADVCFVPCALTLYFWVLHCVFLLSAASQYFGPKVAWLADWRVSGCSLPDLISSQVNTPQLLCCLGPPIVSSIQQTLLILWHSPPLKGACYLYEMYN